MIGFCSRAKEAAECDDDIHGIWRLWNSHQKPGKETGGTGDQKNNWDHVDHSTSKTS